MNARTAVLCVSLVLASATEAICQPAPSGAPTIREERVSDMPGGYPSIFPSPDCCRAALLASTGNANKCRVSVDGKTDAEYDRVVYGTVKFSPDSRRLGYIAVKGNRQTAVVDGKELGEGDEIRELAFSPDSRHVAFVCRTGAKKTVVLDGQAGPDYDNIPMAVPVFSPDSSRMAYVAKIEKTEIDGKPVPPHMRNMPGNYRHVVVVNGKAGPEYDSCSDPQFSPDSRRLAYHVYTWKGDKWAVSVDDRVGPQYNSILSLAFSPDSKRVAYTAINGARQLAVVDDQPGPEYSSVWNLRFSADSRHVAYVATKGDRDAVVLDGKEDPEFGKVDLAARLDGRTTGLLFSPDSGKLAYLAARSNRKVAVVNGQAGPEYDDVKALVISPDSRHFAYHAVKGGKGLVVVDGKPGDEFDEISFDSIVFSPDSTRLAYIGTTARKPAAVVDGKAGPAYDGYIGRARVVFSADSRHYAYPAKQAYKSFVVMDGQAGTQYDGLLEGSPWLTPDGRLVYFVFKNYKYVAVVDGKEGPECEKIVGLGVSTALGPPQPKMHADGTVEYLAVKDGALVRMKHIPAGAGN
ncbi:MAG: hypothetical protein BIFFINMI_01826 [Phycisphaerae bacterium]|nr:hypothetical protein [Phycisphaerae bacterium]